MSTDPEDELADLKKRFHLLEGDRKVQLTVENETKNTKHKGSERHRMSLHLSRSLSFPIFLIIPHSHRGGRDYILLHVEME